MGGLVPRSGSMNIALFGFYLLNSFLILKIFYRDSAIELQISNPSTSDVTLSLVAGPSPSLLHCSQ